MKLNPADYAVTVHCTDKDCGHSYEVEPACVEKQKDGKVTGYFGSAHDFCERCGEPTEESNFVRHLNALAGAKA